MDREELTRRLMSTFLGELEEHVRSINHDLLELERVAGEGRAGLLKTLFRAAHSLKGAARSVGVQPIEALCHRLEGVLSSAGETLPPALVQGLFAAADAIAHAGRQLREGAPIDAQALADVQTRIESLSGGTAPAPRIPTTTVTPQPTEAAWVRVPSGKLDVLLTRVGELQVARGRSEARLGDVEAIRERYDRLRARKLRDDDSEEAAALARDLERLASDLRRDGRAMEQAARPLEDEVRRVRMIRFSEACEGLDRAVRDLAHATGKEVDIEVSGADVELDRAVVGAIRAPLLHLVRNAVDHGAETPSERQAAGKPARARISVSASLRGPEVEVAVADDGRGLDLEAIRAQAARKGLTVPAGDVEAARLVFLPGFTTARMVTEVSGRGVGLDVVKGAVDALHGSVDFSHVPGRGCRFELVVPLTLTSIRVVLVAAGGQTLAIPTTAVRRLLRLGPGDVRTVEGREVILLDGAPVPLVGLSETLGLPATESASPRTRVPAVVIGSADRLAAIAVDELRSEQEVVVKALSRRLTGTPGVAGATVLSDGRTVLILNAGEVASRALGLKAPGGLAAALSTPAAAARKRLLVVEDSVTTRALLKGILEGRGFEVAEAADGAEAWRLLQEAGADLVVSDIEMPRMDGFALTEAIRRSKRFGGLPVVLVTALTSAADKARGLDVGADAYLEKSAFDQTRLLSTIAQLL
ncbi:MAG: response regulator [Planctomycetota bacterium]